MVGVEVWTEPPGAARTSLGPEAQVNEDMLPWAPKPILSRHMLGIRLPALFGRFLRSLPENDPLRSSTRPANGGGAPAYQVDHYERVAQAWHRAREQGRHDTDKAVADLFHVSRSTASVWTRRCRDMGLLDAARTARRTG